MTKPPLLLLQNFSKSFAGRRVLRNVDLELHAGEVHALLGQNGSGKSTLIKILAGYHAPDEGASMTINGVPVVLPISGDSAREHGIAVVHQDLGLADSLSVLENLRVGRYRPALGWRIRWKAERATVRQALREFGLACAPETPVRELREVDRAMLAIVRALHDLEEHSGGTILVLDEPTAYLPRDSTERLFEAIRQVVAGGVGVLFVTHRLQEALSLADRVSVLRDGELVSTDSAQQLTETDLVERLLGFSLGRLYPPPHIPQHDVVLDVAALSGEGVNPVSFHINRGEIVGMTGLVGMGWERIPYLLVGADKSARGTIRICGSPFDLTKLGVRDAMNASMALLPANRLRDGAVGQGSVMENLFLPTLGSYYRQGFLRHRRQRSRAHELLNAFDVRPPTPDRLLITLSGGNQQKVLLAKWFETQPAVLVMHEPTQGVDVGARMRIFQLISDAARAGRSFLLASSEYDDLAHLCDRVLVFRDGNVVATIAGEALTGDRLVELSFREADGGELAVHGRLDRFEPSPSTPEGGN